MRVMWSTHITNIARNWDITKIGSNEGSGTTR